jgi:peptidoglycan hydrolase-like protein with peptidoglycan-binding domain
MSTTTTTPTTTAPNGSSRGRNAFIAAVGVLVGAGIAAGLVIGLGGNATAVTPSAAPAVPASSTTTGGSTHHHVVPPPAPSAAIETLQRELGQLNYYEGPITGTMTTQTEQAITYLQRDAGLPQTGTMNAATTAALAHMLATGNNQMGS